MKRAALVAAFALVTGCVPWRIEGQVTAVRSPEANARVLDVGRGDLAPVANAQIECEGCSDANARTDGGGKFSVDLGAQNSPKVLRVRTDGYAPVDLDVPAAPNGGGVSELTVVLRPIGSAPPAPPPESPTRLPTTACDEVVARMQGSTAIVRVDALEHASLGAVVGAPDRVLVPFSVVEVDRPGTPIRVYDAWGTLHLAHIAATDRKAKTAILALATPVATTPLELRREPGASPCYAAIAPGRWLLREPIPSLQWIDHSSFPSETTNWSAEEGSPILDDAGRVTGVMLWGAGGADARSLADTPKDGAHGRPLIFYGYFDPFAFEFAPAGRLWMGMQGGAGAFYRDLLAMRLDLGFLLLPSPDSRCNEPPCADGLRLSVTPSIGPRIRVGGLFGSLIGSVYVTPSIGYALTAQNVVSVAGDFDYQQKGVTWRAAPGLALQLGPVELATRWKIAPADLRSTTYAITAGFVF